MQPARKQVDDLQLSKKENEGIGYTYNIWYNRWIVSRNEKSTEEVVEARNTIINVKTDCGLTNANQKPGKSFCCLFFARGCCSKGKDCNYLHRIPTDEDEYALSIGNDIFGRTRHEIDQDNYMGVGSFNRPNKSICVYNFKPIENILQKLWNVFKDFGEITQMRLLHQSIAIIFFKNRANAEFAKEAMLGQKFEDSVLITRWASINESGETIEQKSIIHSEFDSKSEERLRKLMEGNRYESYKRTPSIESKEMEQEPINVEENQAELDKMWDILPE
eukprot:TRINITY_DN3193_c1_g2_i1.p1 TRINITY_DN3193_c1_g2~~TRINITY_DN3193_c1_g2_i1.p1  ORF type:complete len:285 (-),score=80.41 TRINITY_DN3193_c1_g2_i1:80-907(-)